MLRHVGCPGAPHCGPNPKAPSPVAAREAAARVWPLRTSLGPQPSGRRYLAKTRAHGYPDDVATHKPEPSRFARLRRGALLWFFGSALGGYAVGTYAPKDLESLVSRALGSGDKPHERLPESITPTPSADNPAREDPRSKSGQ